MFCSKCHTEIRDENIKFCPRCGQEIGNKRTTNHFYFGSTFKKTNEHENQYDYSKNYSNVLDDNPDTHQEQYNYSKSYSDVKKDKTDEHDKQYDYSKNYSDVKKDKADEHENQYRYSAKYSDANTINITSDEDYIKAYINNNYNSIKKQKFNIAALIFGPFYCIYRKMYLLGIILIIIESSFLFSIGGDYSTLVELFINLYLAIKINEIYLKKVNNNIETIKSNNPDKTSKELIEICSKKGGTIPIKLFIILLFIIPMIISILTILFEYDESINEKTISNNTYKVRDITFNTPNNFEEMTTNEIYYYMKSNDNKCYLNTFSISYSGDINNYLSYNSNSSSNTNKTDIYTWEHKNNNWNYIMMNTSYGEKDIYATKYNGYLYVFTFEGDCNEYKPDILNSINYN